jgi:hypothetical protein
VAAFHGRGPTRFWVKVLWSSRVPAVIIDRISTISSISSRDSSGCSRSIAFRVGAELGVSCHIRGCQPILIRVQERCPFPGDGREGAGTAAGFGSRRADRSLSGRPDPIGRRSRLGRRPWACGLETNVCSPTDVSVEPVLQTPAPAFAIDRRRLPQFSGRGPESASAFAHVRGRSSWLPSNRYQSASRESLRGQGRIGCRMLCRRFGRRRQQVTSGAGNAPHPNTT